MTEADDFGIELKKANFDQRQKLRDSAISSLTTAIERIKNVRERLHQIQRDESQFIFGPGLEERHVSDISTQLLYAFSSAIQADCLARAYTLNHEVKEKMQDLLTSQHKGIQSEE